MNLSEAIKIGSRYRPQTIGSWIGQWGGSCAMGAAYEGYFGFNIQNIFKGGVDIAIELTKVFPILNKNQNCPACDDLPDYGQKVSGAIACLNDSHGWTREEIADWVETIEDTCHREHEDEHPAPLDPKHPIKEPVNPDRELVPA